MEGMEGKIVNADSLGFKPRGVHSVAISKLQVGEAYVCKTKSNLLTCAHQLKNKKSSPFPSTARFSQRTLPDGSAVLIRLA